MEENFLSLVRGLEGHFRLESGHHGDVWFELETLCLHSRKIRRSPPNWQQNSFGTEWR